jgi:leader peptidase (prepilin peptidase) / N-methyltransferase
MVIFALFLFLFLFGAIVGSFLNVCILRIPDGESIVWPGSRCPSCKSAIAGYDNIPILSWLILRAKCRSCQAPISPRYWVVELLTATAAVAAYFRVGLGFEWLVVFAFIASLIVITFIDLDHRIIPDVISLPGIVAGFVLSARHDPWLPSMLDSLIGILFGGGILFVVAWGYEKATGREGMGGGDVKLLAMIGAFLGWQSIPFTLLISSLSGSVIGVSLMWWTGSDTKYAIPFGPFLALGALIYVFCGEELMRWYLGLSGA